MSVQNDICEVIRQAFTAATARPPPKGIGHSPQSRAIYGVDVMLQWMKAGGGTGKLHAFYLNSSNMDSSTCAVSVVVLGS